MQTKKANYVDKEVIKAYRKDLKSALDNKEDRLVFNDGPVKAGIFMTTLLESAKSSVLIYSHNLNSKVTEDSDFIKAFSTVVRNKNINVDIILNEKTDNKLIQKEIDEYFTSSYNNTINYLESIECVNKVLGGEKHFAIVDSLKARIENDIDGYKAIGNLGDYEFGESLSKFFITLKENCIKATV